MKKARGMRNKEKFLAKMEELGTYSVKNDEGQIIFYFQGMGDSVAGYIEVNGACFVNR